MLAGAGRGAAPAEESHPILSAQLIFQPPELLGVIPALALAAVAFEAVVLAGQQVRSQGPASGGLRAAVCLLAGPLVVIVGALRAAALDEGTRRPDSAGLIRAGATGSLLAGAAVATFAWQVGPLLALALVAGLWGVRAYGRTTAPLSRGRKAALLALRLIAVGAVFLAVARPAIERVSFRTLPSAVLVGVDVSGSMARPDGDGRSAPSSPTRIEAARRALTRHADALDRLDARGEVHLFTFAGEVTAAQPLRGVTAGVFLAGVDADRPVTAIGDALTEALQPVTAAGTPVGAIVIVSDGSNNTAELLAPERFARLMGARGVPVYTVGVGRSDRAATASLALSAVRCPERVDAFDHLPVATELHATQLAGRDIDVSFHFGDRRIEQRTLTPRDNDAALPVQFDHVPRTGGFHRVKITASVRDAQPADPPPVERSRLVQVLDRQLRVLYIEGRFRYEKKYIARALAGWDRVSLQSAVLLGPPGDDRPTPLRDDPNDWLGYHGVILGDLPASALTERQLEILRDLVVTHGRGLAMIGGPDSFAGGGWADTPLAGVLPVDLARSKGQIDRPVTVVPTASAEELAFMRIDPNAPPADGWARLGPLPGANVLVPAGRAENVVARNVAGRPMVIASAAGEGRTLAIAFDMSWRWVLTPRDTAPLQKRFWRQVALFLCNPQGSAWITTDQGRYDLRHLADGREWIAFTAGVETPAGRPARDADIRITLAGDHSPQTDLPVRWAGRVLKGRLPALPWNAMDDRSELRLRIDATVAGRTLSGEQRVELIRRNLEDLSPVADHDLLQRMAEQSGGRFATLDRLDRLLGRVEIAAEPTRVETVAHEDLTALDSPAGRWGAAGLLLALAGVLSAEWALRKKLGLV